MHLLSKLNATRLPLEPSGARGTGTPRLTPQDIAAAMGIAAAGGERARISVNVLCLRWWPAALEAVPRTVGRRATASGERVPIEAPGETPAYRELVGGIVAQLRKRTTLDEARRPGIYERWARAVIDEFRNPRHCPKCQPWGRAGAIPKPHAEGGKVVRVTWELCEECHGNGTLAWGKYRRAKAITMREQTYRDMRLDEVHEVALSCLRVAERRGARLVRSAL